MLHRPFDPTVIYGGFSTYAKWQTSAVVETGNICQWHVSNLPGTDAKPPIKRKLYGQLKPSLADYFKSKCAYCESDFEVVAFEDVEHYRPKCGVTDEPGHRGYYWLSYNERNLLPSCERCNRAEGKKNHFPISGVRVSGPGGDLAGEDPLLLNPYESGDFDPVQPHLEHTCEELDSELWPTGVLKGLTPKGEKSVEVYNLNRVRLVKARLRAQTAAIKALKLALTTPQAFETEWKACTADGQPYLSGVIATCRAWYRHHRALLDAVTIWRPRH